MGKYAHLLQALKHKHLLNTPLKKREQKQGYCMWYRKKYKYTLELKHTQDTQITELADTKEMVQFSMTSQHKRKSNTLIMVPNNY